MNRARPENSLPRRSTLVAKPGGAESEARQSLFAVLDNFPHPSLLHDGMVVIHGNLAAAQLWGTDDAAQLEGRHLETILPGNARPQLDTQQASVGQSSVTQLLRLDGQTIDIALQESVIEIDDDMLIQVVFGHCEQQQRPATLARGTAPDSQTRPQLYALGESSPDSMLLMDPTGKILYLNRSNGRAPIETFIGTSVYTLLRRPDRERFQACVQRVRETGKIDQCVVRYHETDGAVRVFETRVCPVIDQGNITALAVNGHEITDRPSSESHVWGGQRTRANEAVLEFGEATPMDDDTAVHPTAADEALVQALRRAHDELQHVAASVSAGLWSLRVSADGQWSDFYRSPVTDTIMGRSLESIGQRPDLWLATLHQEDQSSVLEALDRLLRCAPTHDEAEYRILLPDGTSKWVRNSTNARRLPDGSIRLDGVLSDITDRKAVEAALRESDEQLRRHQDELAHAGRLSTMGELVASIAHEINQPLYAIANYAGACRNALHDPAPDSIERVARWTQEIATQSRRAGEIIARLGSFVRKSPPHRSTINVNNLVIDSIDLLRFETRRQQVRIGIALAPAVPSILADRVQIQQVLVNLIRNAVDALEFAPPAKRRVAITVEACEDRIVVHVEDKGKGLTADEHTMLFEPFFTTKPRGMGMGLAISRSIVTAHGGRLWATANPDLGTTFHFELPAHQAE